MTGTALTVRAALVRHSESVNHAYADGSQQGEEGGWGVVLLVPGAPDARFYGRVQVNDNGVCELIAVREAVRLAPENQPLTVHTDATCAVQAVRRGTAHPQQDELGAQVRSLARARGIELRLTLGPRDSRRIKEAHELATASRLGSSPELPRRPQVRVRVRRLAWGAQAVLTFRRGGSTRRLELPLPARENVPPALLALGALIEHAERGEHLSVRIESALAPAAWEHPAQAPHPEARAAVEAARAAAAARDITLEFV